MSAKKIRLAESLIIIYDTIIYMKYNKEMNHIIIVHIPGYSRPPIPVIVGHLS